MTTAKRNPRKETHEKFFYRNSEYGRGIYAPEAGRTEEERREGAKKLAEAEKWAKANGYSFEWIAVDDPPDNYTIDVTACRNLDPDEICEILELSMVNADGKVVRIVEAPELIPGQTPIAFGFDDDENSTHQRVFKAELALEEMNSRWKSTASPSSSDVDTINRHRRSIGMPPIDLASGWSSAELRDMAESIRSSGKMTNPLKRKLMR